MCAPNATLAKIHLAMPTAQPDEIFIPCWLWQSGTSRGRPIMRIPGHQPAHPVPLLIQGTHHKRICGQKLCVNPRHFVFTPRPPSMIQHILVFEAEAEIEKYPTLEDAFRGIDIPNIHILEAWRNRKQMELSSHDRPHDP